MQKITKSKNHKIIQHKKPISTGKFFLFLLLPKPWRLNVNKNKVHSCYKGCPLEKHFLFGSFSVLVRNIYFSFPVETKSKFEVKKAATITKQRGGDESNINLVHAFHFKGLQKHITNNKEKKMHITSKSNNHKKGCRKLFF
jgi:hypothetical protein